MSGHGRWTPATVWQGTLSLVKARWVANAEHAAYRAPLSLAVSRWVFLRCLGVIYLIAFVSLWSQILGLIGSDGILPIQPFLAAVREQLGPRAYTALPTLCWLNAGDAALQLLCGCGVILAVLLIAGVAQAPVLLLLWILYLSLVTVCRVFLSFQWDILLLETGFLAVFFAPLRMWPASTRASPPSSTIVWLLRWLLLRLIFASGVVKLASGDPVWRSLAALSYHYETQPLATWTAWYVHQLPAWFHQLSVALMFSIELGLPLMIIGPRRIRHVAFVGLVALQLLIISTGNYGYFNLLAIALCLLLLDDVAWPRRLRQLVARLEPDDRSREPRRWPRWVIVPVAALILLLSVVPVGSLVRRGVYVPQPVRNFYRLIAPLHLVNSYGLFAKMTTSRPEIIVEGSYDGVDWRAYEFRDKPGEVTRRPEFVAPHMPRLDWQMWFAALGTYQSNPWFIEFCTKLLQGSPPVLALLAHNPFPDAPPRFIRAVVYDYHFTDQKMRRATGQWWRRELLRPYCPILSLQ